MNAKILAHICKKTPDVLKQCAYYCSRIEEKHEESPEKLSYAHFYRKYPGIILNLTHNMIGTLMNENKMHVLFH